MIDAARGCARRRWLRIDLRAAFCLILPLALAGCGDVGVTDDMRYSGAGYRPAYSQCEYDAQAAAAGNATLADRVQARTDLLRACLAKKGY